MIEFIHGEVLELMPTEVVINAQPFGFRVQISLYTHEAIKGKKNIKLFTHLNIKNEGQSLSGYEIYGFATEIERNYFSTIIGVSGIGTSTARLMLSAMQPQEISKAIAYEDVSKITSVKGIGPKTAKRMILELKDKLPETSNEENNYKVKSSNQSNTIEAEALSALMMLGFSKIAAQNAISSTLKNEKPKTLEELIKSCLKKL